jgi:ABC-type transporter Mla subunit MlaD
VVKFRYKGGFFMSDELQLDMPKSKKKWLLITTGIILLLVVVAGFWYLNYHNKVNAEKQYKENMSLFLLQSTKVGAKAESMINTYQEVWHDDIFNDGYTTSNGTYHKDRLNNFNQAIKDQWNIYDVLGDNKELKRDMDNVDKTINVLKNPPTQYKDLYKEIVDLYTDLSRFVEKANNPSGSLQSYTNDANSMDTDITKKIDSIRVQLPK